jgi:general stress protein 26
VHETVEELNDLQRLLDASALSAGPHLRDIITDDRRLTAGELCDELQGMRLLVLGTATADGRPLVGPVDGYFIHGSFWFSSGKNSVRMRHIAARPFVSATYLPGEHLAVTVHGRAEIFEISDSRRPELREAMLAHYLPLQGPTFEDWLNDEDSLGARIEADKIFTFKM